MGKGQGLPRQGKRRASRGDSARVPALRTGPGASSERVGSFARTYRLALPPAWQEWCEKQGWLEQPDAGWELLGLVPAPSGMDAAAMFAGMRLALRKTVPGGFPADLIPVERLPERQLACIRLDGRDDPPVVIIDLDDPGSWHDAQPAADSFSRYAQDFAEQAGALRGVMGFLHYTQREVDSGHRAPGQAPRPDDWRAYRFCSQNVVVSMLVLRHNRDDNVLDVGACLITALSRLDPDAPARAICTLLLAEAYRAGGDLTLRFVQGIRRGADRLAVPWPIMRWAERCGIEIDRDSGLVPADAARRLFIESVRADEHLAGRLRGGSMRVEAPAICYGIASGLWEPTEVEAMLAWSARPGQLLRGVTDPLDRAVYAADLLDVRSAMLLAALVRRVAAGDGDRKLDAEDAVQSVAAVADNDGTCLLRAKALLIDDWTIGSLPVRGASAIRVAVADAEPDQLPSAIDFALARLQPHAAAGPLRAVLCPRDLLALGIPARNTAVHATDRAGVVLLAAPQYTPALTIRAADKLSRARTARQ